MLRDGTTLAVTDSFALFKEVLYSSVDAGLLLDVLISLDDNLELSALGQIPTTNPARKCHDASIVPKSTVSEPIMLASYL